MIKKLKRYCVRICFLLLIAQFFWVFLSQSTLSVRQSPLDAPSESKGNKQPELFDVEEKRTDRNHSFRPPSIRDHLPHLTMNDSSLTPSFLASDGRSNVSVVFGVPTVKRPVKSYLMDTLRSLIDSLSPTERRDALIIVMVAEPYDPVAVLTIYSEVRSLFAQHLDAGLLEVMAPHSSFYPDLDSIPPNLGDTKERTKWRSKQNLDYAFLMMYAKSRGHFYCQLEDDIIAKPGFLTTIKSFALKQNSSEWILLEFSHLGFIGKLFKSSTLSSLVDFFLLFYRNQPVDWLLDHFIKLRVCSQGRLAGDCVKQKDKVRLRFTPSQFQHMGDRSSFKGENHSVKDKDFTKRFPNPPAKVFTSLQTYKNFILERAYNFRSKFWSLEPKKGDFILFEFDAPVRLKAFHFSTGDAEHPEDRLRAGVVEAQPGGHSASEGYRVLARFSNETRAASLTLNETDSDALGLVGRLRVRAEADSANWLIVEEMRIEAWPHVRG